MTELLAELCSDICPVPAFLSLGKGGRTTYPREIRIGSGSFGRPVILPKTRRPVAIEPQKKNNRKTAQKRVQFDGPPPRPPTWKTFHFGRPEE